MVSSHKSWDIEDSVRHLKFFCPTAQSYFSSGEKCLEVCLGKEHWSFLHSVSSNLSENSGSLSKHMTMLREGIGPSVPSLRGLHCPSPPWPLLQLSAPLSGNSPLMLSDRLSYYPTLQTRTLKFRAGKALSAEPLNLRTLWSGLRFRNSNIYDSRQNMVQGSQEGERNFGSWLLVVGLHGLREHSQSSRCPLPPEHWYFTCPWYSPAEKLTHLHSMMKNNHLS